MTRTENETDLDRIRGAALDRIESAKRRFLWLVLGAGLFEVLFLVLCFVVADLGDRLHQLILCTAFLIYGTLALCVLALGGYVSLQAQRILKSIELAADREEMERTT